MGLEDVVTLPYVRLEVFTAVTIKNVVFWDVRTQFVPLRYRPQPDNAM
jgi:hypothetical protein